MKKRIAYLLILSCCFLLSGCTTVDAKEIYTQALEDMNNDVYYFKSEHKIYLYDTLTTVWKTECIRSDKKEENLVISSVTSPTSDTLMQNIFDGTTKHVYEISKQQNIFKHENTILEKEDVKKPLFKTIINDSESFKIVDSKVENKNNQKILYFTVSSVDDENKINWTVKYIITMQDGFIIQEEQQSYPMGEDTLSQRDVITYSDINKTKTIDIDAILKEMESYRP